jgi:Cleavage and polyadenylation factor 2 C-terminal
MLSLLAGETERVPAARPLHVGQVRLLELKQQLQNVGYDAVLGEGVLVCDGVVRVLKEEGGSGVRIEGVITGDSARKTYWDVRRAVYEGLAVV